MKISYTGVSDCCAEINKSVSKLKELVEDIKLSCETLQKSTWISPGADYFCKKLNAVLGGYSSIDLQFANCLANIDKCMENYKAVDSIFTGGSISTPNLGKSDNTVMEKLHVI